MYEKTNYQDEFLNENRKNKTPVVAFTINGYQLHGTIEKFDDEAVFLSCDGKLNMVYKTAISTIVSAER